MISPGNWACSGLAPCESRRAWSRRDKNMLSADFSRRAGALNAFSTALRERATGRVVPRGSLQKPKVWPRRTVRSANNLAYATAFILLMCIAVQTRHIPVHILARKSAGYFFPSFQGLLAKMNRQQILIKYRNEPSGDSHE